MINKRPRIITAICVMGFIGALFNVLTISLKFYDMAKIGAWYPLFHPCLSLPNTAVGLKCMINLWTWYTPCLVFSTLVTLICIIGLWMMKKWSIITYTVFFGILNIVLIVWEGMRIEYIFSLIIVGILAVIVFSKYKLMD